MRIETIAVAKNADRIAKAVLFVFLFSSCCACAQLTGEQILEKNLEATGGRAAWSRVHTIVKSGTVIAHTLLPHMSPEPTRPAEQAGTVRIYIAPPDRYLFYVSNPLTAFTYQGCYRFSRWAYVPMRGIQHFTGEMRDCKAVLAPEHWSDLYESIELKGTKKINERKTYAVRVTRHGQSATLYFDADTFLLLRSTGVFAPGGPPEVAHQTDYEDYGDVDGLKFAYTLVESINGGQSRTHFGAIYVDAKISDSIFEPANNNHDKK